MKNESAFPTSIPIGDGPLGGEVFGGLTKREYFAAVCLQGFISTLTINRDDHAELLSQTSVKYADALIAELERKEE